jgi:proteic killer suppression protein
VRLAQSLFTAKRGFGLLFDVAFEITCAAMISSFRHKDLRDFFETNSKRGIPPELSTRWRDRLDVIDAAGSLEDIALPHFGLHELKGERAGTWAVKVNKNWRLTFKFASGDASDVNFEDYH